MKRSTLRNLRIELTARGLYPRTLLGKYVISATAVTLLSWLVRRIWMWFSPASDPLWLWMLLLWGTTGVLAFIYGVRWVRHTLMWRLRNRLIVTYVFIGVIPVLLLLAMGGVAGYIFGGQFATYVATNDFNLQLERLSAANGALMGEAQSMARAGRLEGHAQELLDDTVSDGGFPGREVSVWYAGRGFLVRGPKGGKPLPVGPYAQDGYRSLVLDGGKVYLRCVSRQNNGKDEIVVASSVPVDRLLVERLADDLGRITLVPTATQTTPVRAAGQAQDGSGEQAESPRIIALGRATESGAIAGGRLRPAAHRFDVELAFGTVFQLHKWEDGAPAFWTLMVQTRISQLYQRLFDTLGQGTTIFVLLLGTIAIVLALIELVALLIGIRLSRTMTRSVADLYEATQHVNRGSFNHRIQIRSRDQLAALEGAFNSMTESIEKLIIEQKEKQKLESELAIAQEVQALLFPRETSHLQSLELHGVCRPARTVSGDYYDFLPLGPDQIGLAVGDISGKGISAALLMATVHAFIRAYTLEEALTEARVGAAVGGTLTLAHPEEHLPPASLLALLNAQLFRSTPDSKYATMFLGFYHGPTRRFTYSNAGHLPPFIVSPDGRIRKLGNGGMVVGLFGGVTYENETVDLTPGEILVAYSDGVTEPESEFGEFGEERLLEIVRENSSLPLPRIADAVTTAVTDWIGGSEQPDDITIVLARAR